MSLSTQRRSDVHVTTYLNSRQLADLKTLIKSGQGAFTAYYLDFWAYQLNQSFSHEHLLRPPKSQISVKGAERGICLCHVISDVLNTKLPPHLNVDLESFCKELRAIGLLTMKRQYPHEILEYAATKGVPLSDVAERAMVLSYGQVCLTDCKTLDSLLTAFAMRHYGCLIMGLSMDTEFHNGEPYLESIGPYVDNHAVMGFRYSYESTFGMFGLSLNYRNGWKDKYGNYHGVTNVRQIGRVGTFYVGNVDVV